MNMTLPTKLKKVTWNKTFATKSAPDEENHRQVDTTTMVHFSFLIATEGSRETTMEGSKMTAMEGSKLTTVEGSNVTATEVSKVTAMEGSNVTAMEGSRVTAVGGSEET